MTTHGDESVRLEDHDPKWSFLANSERSTLSRLLTVSSEKVQHIGSTAVPGLPAKPIIDLQLGVSAYPPSEALVATICSLGYECLGEYGLSGRFYFRKRGTVAVNLHAMLLDSERWLNNLAFRNYLLRSRSARDRYASAKRAAMESGARTLLAYSEAKSPIVCELLAEAIAGNDA